MPLAFINHPLHYQPVLISCSSKSRFKLTTKHIISGTAHDWIWNLYFWDCPLRQTCRGDHLAERCNKTQAIMNAALTKKTPNKQKSKHLRLVNLMLKVIAKSFSRIINCYMAQRKQRRCSKKACMEHYVLAATTQSQGKITIHVFILY